MTNGLLGKKLGMSQVFAADGQRIPVTVLEVGPCTVLQRKTTASDGYEAAQLGFQAKASQRVNKPEMGHFKNSGKGAFAYVREFKLTGDCSVGDQVCCDLFSPGDRVDITGTSKGKGFQGVIKRWGFSGGRATHGSMFKRRPGAIGQSAWPAKVIKGKKMPGQLGNVRVTTQNLIVVDVRPEQNLVFVRGAVPGSKNGLIEIRKGIKA
ncbi:LSU ribosomal protein L3P [Desulfuromusa kysingii]|uniref:Large ribosomal subunit protein uL3 n=1 Tax=Desulfuromusa kysingii TaxID=37625 RepID=A0A1H3WB52_9BACT|nr:50S ribosomal protein L3 [Desulfuromusa kysingii]SDZ84305.1 LSU ribosomal protein L3P [Desulfuromusa kysingii]